MQRRERVARSITPGHHPLLPPSFLRLRGTMIISFPLSALGMTQVRIRTVAASRISKVDFGSVRLPAVSSSTAISTLRATRLFGMGAQHKLYQPLSIEVPSQAGLAVRPGLPLGRTSLAAMWTPLHFRGTYMRFQLSVATTTQQETPLGSNCLTQPPAILGQHRPALLPLQQASPSRFTEIRFAGRGWKHCAPTLPQKPRFGIDWRQQRRET